MTKSLKLKLSVAVAALAASNAFAASVSYDVFGSLSTANFGGSGIPNSAVAITNLSGGVTLGLTATPRFFSPAVTNDGAGVFHAQSGAYGPGDNLALWSFNFYVGGTSPTSLGQYTYKLFGDYSSAVGDADSTYADISGYLGVADSLLTAGTIQNTENLGFGTTYAQFDPTVAGQYGFILAAYNLDGSVAGRSAIVVNVGDVPEPTSLALVGLALAAAGASRRRKA